MRKLKDPSREDKFPSINIDQNSFDVMFNDMPASEIGKGSQLLINTHTYP